MTVLTLRPSAAGDRSEWDGSDYNKVSDQSDLTFITTLPDDISWVINLCNLPDMIPADAIISNVATGIRAKSTDNVHKCTFYAMVKTEATEYAYGAWVIGNAYTDKTQSLDLNPNTGLAWTVAQINALQIGVKSKTLKAGLAYYVGYCSEIWAIITYTQPVAGNLKRLLMGVGL